MHKPLLLLLSVALVAAVAGLAYCIATSSSADSPPPGAPLRPDRPDSETLAILERVRVVEDRVSALEGKLASDGHAAVEDGGDLDPVSPLSDLSSLGFFARVEYYVLRLDADSPSIRTEESQNDKGGITASEYLLVRIPWDRVRVVSIEALGRTAQGEMQWKNLDEWRQDRSDLLILRERQVRTNGSKYTERPLAESKMLRIAIER